MLVISKFGEAARSCLPTPYTEVLMLPREKPYVYLAAPYTKGDPAANTFAQMKIWDKLVDDGLVTPYAPLWSHFQHGVTPRRYEDWTRYDFEVMAASNFDACLRMDAVVPHINYHVSESSGADAEVAWCQERGIPVFYSIPKLYEAIRDGKLACRQCDTV